MSSELKPVYQSVRTAWRRLFAQALLNHLAVGWSVALAITLSFYNNHATVDIDHADDLKG